MKTLIIYDNDGNIFLQMSGSHVVPNGGIQYLEVDSETHKNKIIKGVNVKTKELILEDMPKTETEILQDKINQLESDMANLMLEMAMGGVVHELV